MLEIVWRLDDPAGQHTHQPDSADEAREVLTRGNLTFAETLWRAEEGSGDFRQVVHLSATKLGLSTHEHIYPEQRPFAVVVGCADARVPIEMVLWQQANDLFVVRVAGNTPGLHASGSLDYAIQNLETVRLLVVMGHTGCGAVTAAVEAFLSPADYMSITADMPLRSIVDSIMTAVVGAADALASVHGDKVRAEPGYRVALIELSTVLNAALTATTVQRTFEKRLGPDLAVVYGVLNLHNHLVGLPATEDSTGDWQSGLQEPPASPADLVALARRIAQSRFVVQRLHPQSRS